MLQNIHKLTGVIPGGSKESWGPFLNSFPSLQAMFSLELIVELTRNKN